MLAKKLPTKADKAWFAACHELGCAVCGKMTELETHHVTGAGMGLRSAHTDSFSLCHFHHRTGGYGHAVHAGTKEWEKRYGSQTEILERVRTELA